MLRETPRPGAPGTAHPSSSRSQGNATHTAIYSGNPSLAAKLREFLKRKPPTPVTKPRMQVLHQPLLTTLHPQKGFWRGGRALSLLTQFIIKQPASQPAAGDRTGFQEGKTSLLGGQIGLECSKGLNESLP